MYSYSYYHIQSQISIQQPDNHYVDVVETGYSLASFTNATEICEKFGKHPCSWLAKGTTLLYIDLVTAKTGLSSTDLILRVPGDNPADEDHWIHATLVPDLMDWLMNCPGFTMRVSYNIQAVSPIATTEKKVLIRNCRLKKVC